VPDSFTQPYFGPSDSWPQLVVLPEANGLVLNRYTVQWNTADIDKVNMVLPRAGSLITRIDRPFSELADMPGSDVWSQHSRVGTVIIHGAFNPDAHNDSDACSAPFTSETTKTHKVVQSVAGVTVHVLSEDFFGSFRPNYLESPQALNLAFNHALVGITALQLPDLRIPYEEQFANGVTTPHYYDLVCARAEPYLSSLTCTAYRTRYPTLAS
jgi:hypothetical protein